MGSKEFGEKAGLKPRARIRSFASIGSEPAIMLTGPAPASEKALKRAGMSVGDIDLFDAANAEEMFLTSTSLCILPVRSFNGAAVGDGKAPGPITQKLIDAYSKSVGCDFVAQYLKFSQ